jgi:hypothetical protein
MHPELHEDHALGREAGLEGRDLAVGPLPLLLGGEPLDPLDEDPAVPGPVEHRHAAPARKLGPEPPQEVVALLVVRRCRELRNAHVPRVEMVHEPLDGAALAGGVPALEDDAQRRPDGAVAQLTAEGEAQPQESVLLLPEL